MENKKRSFITNIERVLNSKELTEQQRKALLAFDRFNELESGCSLNTRSIYLRNLFDLARAATLNEIPIISESREPVKCKKCGKVLVVRE